MDKTTLTVDEDVVEDEYQVSVEFRGGWFE